MNMRGRLYDISNVQQVVGRIRRASAKNNVLVFPVGRPALRVTRSRKFKSQVGKSLGFG